MAKQKFRITNCKHDNKALINRRSIAEMAMYRVKQLFGGPLTLRDYDGRVVEVMAMVRALNKMMIDVVVFSHILWQGEWDKLYITPVWCDI